MGAREARVQHRTRAPRRGSRDSARRAALRVACLALLAGGAAAPAPGAAEATAVAVAPRHLAVCDRAPARPRARAPACPRDRATRASSRDPRVLARPGALWRALARPRARVRLSREGRVPAPR